MGLGEEGGQVQKGDLSPTHQPPPPGSRPEARSWAAVMGGQASREEGGGQHLGELGGGQPPGARQQWGVGGAPTLLGLGG